jgi:hypothetical protein
VENLVDAIMNRIAEIRKQNENENEILNQNLSYVLEILKGMMTSIIDQNEQIGMVTQNTNKEINENEKWIEENLKNRQEEPLKLWSIVTDRSE